MAKQLKSIADQIAMSCLASRTRLLSRVVAGIYDQHLREVGLTSPQMTILVALEHTGGVLPTRLGDVLKIDKSTLSRNVDRMVRNGWIDRRPGKDARSHEIRLSQAGRRLLRKAVPHWRAAQTEAEELIGEGTRDALLRTTKRIRGF